MACSACEKRRQARMRVANRNLVTGPLGVSEIDVLADGRIKSFESSDWKEERHHLLVLIPEVNTPVCETELGAISDWAPKFDLLDCDITVLGTDSIDAFKTWLETEPMLANPKYSVFSSRVLVERLGLLDGGRPKRASVFITKEGEVVKQEHFHDVGRSFAELHRMLWGYTTGSYCAEGWTPSV